MKLNNIAVMVSSNDPIVRYTRDSGVHIGEIIAIIFIPATLLIDPVVRTIADQKTDARFKQHIDIAQITFVLADSFIATLTQAKVFDAIDNIPQRDESSLNRISIANYDAVVKLFIREVSLRRAFGKKVNMYADVRAEMTDLNSARVVWRRQEQLVGETPRLLDYYIENSVAELNAMLKKIGIRLANDFVYLQ
jgi:hypothetical protein